MAFHRDELTPGLRHKYLVLQSNVYTTSEVPSTQAKALVFALHLSQKKHRHPQAFNVLQQL